MYSRNVRMALLATGLGLAGPALGAEACPGPDNEELKACRSDESVAREALAKRISVEIRAEEETYQKRESNNGLLSSLSFWDNGAESRFEASSIQKTNVFLEGVRVRKDGGEYCATVCSADLLDLTRNRIDHLLGTVSLDALPAQRGQRIETLDAELAQVDKVWPLVVYFSPEEVGSSRVEELEQLEQELREERNGLKEQAVTIRITGDYQELWVNGAPISRTDGEIPLDAGVHTYRVTGSEHCPAQGRFTLEPGEVHSVSVDMADHAYPRVVFRANQPEHRIDLTVAGDSFELGQEKVIRSCEEAVSYRFEYAGQVESGSVDLMPGETEEVVANFLSPQQQDHLDRVAQGRESGSTLQGSVLLYSPGEGDWGDGGDSFYGGEALWLQNWQYLRYGAGVRAAQGTDSQSLEGVFHLRLQLTRFGSPSLPPNLGDVAIMPWIGMDGGVGYREVGGIDDFADEDASTALRNARNHGVLRVRAGLEMSFHSGFGIALHGGRDLTMDEGWTAGLGLSINLPD